MTGPENPIDGTRGAVRTEVRPVSGHVLVKLSGEFDDHELGLLRGALDGASSNALPVEVDLSGVTFLDLRCARELIAQSCSRGSRAALCHPSWQSISSFEALGFVGILSGRGKDRQRAGRVLDGTLAHAV